jgi:hypothetical protein
MRDFVPEHICRTCYRVVTPGKDCAACTRWYESWNAQTYTLDSILNLQPGWWLSR